MEGAEASVSSLLVGDAAPLVAQGHWRRGSCMTRMAGESYRRFWSLPWPREPVCLPRASLLEKCSLQVLWVLGKSGFEQSLRRCGPQPQKAVSFQVPATVGRGGGGRTSSGKLLEERAHRAQLPWPPCSCSTLLPWLPARHPEHPTQGPGICSPSTLPTSSLLSLPLSGTFQSHGCLGPLCGLFLPLRHWLLLRRP